MFRLLQSNRLLFLSLILFSIMLSNVDDYDFFFFFFRRLWLCAPFKMNEESRMEQITLKLYEIIELDAYVFVYIALSNIKNNIKSHWTYMLFIRSSARPSK